MQRLSESVFTGLCHKVGTPSHVIIRRDVVDITETFTNEILAKSACSMIVSGSHREGFRLEGSDVDIMPFPNNAYVVWDIDQAQNYELGEIFLLLCDSSESPPGYTLLRINLIRNMTGGLTNLYKKYLFAGFKINNNIYISSSKYKQFFGAFLQRGTEHGPCINTYVGGAEFDMALCVQCSFWPPSASSWIDRCHSWPQPHVVEDIVKNGCHFVAIGHKLGRLKDHEWRISFSQAEQKLVYSMNHSQFLTYGLLKIFLKEIINSGIATHDKLLCSYHMKTAVFWVIQQKAIPHWYPQTLLEGFWVCFKLLLRWVYEGVCPNFFIPENNMFLSNIHGVAQRLPFSRLYELYEKGLACLLSSPTIRPYVIKVFYNPRQYICTDEFNPRQSTFENLETAMFLHLDFMKEIYNSQFVSLPIQSGGIVSLETVEHLIGFPLTQYQAVWLQRVAALCFHRIPFLIFYRLTDTGANKLMYRVDKMSCHMLSLAAKFGCFSDTLYLAMRFFHTSRYMKALSIIELTKTKFAQSYAMFNNILVWLERFCQLARGKFSSVLMHITPVNINLHSCYYYMNELIPEQSVLKRSDNLCIPPLVLLYMLEFLCAIHTDSIRAQRALNDLHDVVHFDLEEYKDISWQILGICQQITGNLQAALFSYQQSLRQTPRCGIQTVTLKRIQDIIMTANQL
ncbi:uncharacterized protein LOC134248963 [Saccostrea cucullata]|uniref:uncharacterized protein LOC134248963 n=1 Tax=Saccostrea cuccullata TaxID=36930 RepID=UPI002ED20FAB